MANFFNNHPNNFDQIVYARLHAPDFAQPQIQDSDFYKSKAVSQIESAIQDICSAKNHPELVAATAQANAFINAALDYEFICLSEKASWLKKVASAVRGQLIGESV